jgi:hypothetical protein
LRCRVQRVMSAGGSGMPALIEQGPYRTAGTPVATENLIRLAQMP